MLDALHRCWFSYFLGISVWLKYFISTQKFCYFRLIHANFGILFLCAFTSVISQALFTLISIALSVIFFFPFSYKLICCDSFLPGLPTHTLSALHSKLILMNDSFHLISNCLEVFSSCDYWQNIPLFITLVIKSLCGLASTLPFHISHDDPLPVSEHFIYFPMLIPFLMLFFFLGIPFHPYLFPVLPLYVHE